MSKTEQASPLPETVKPDDSRPDPASHAELHLQLLEQYAPPSLVLNGDYDIVHMSPRAGRYLHMAGGEPSPNLLSLIREELRTLVRTALLQAMEGHRGVDLRGLRMRTDEGEESIDIHIRPVLGRGNPARGFILVVFEPASAEPIARPAVSRELEARTEALAHATNDLQNPVSSTRIAAIFLDRSMHVTLFTPGTRELFELKPGDVGRPLSDIATKLACDGLLDDAKAVLRSLQSVEREVAAADGRTFLMGALPYRTDDDRIAGVVMTFIDVTERKRELDEIGRARFELEARVEERTAKLQQDNRSLRREAHDRDLAEHARAALARQLANAQEAERRRIARELHDQLGQQVSALLLKLAMLRDAPSLPAKAREEIERLERIARRLDADLDFLVWELRPTALDDLGLRAALADYADNWSRHFEVQAEVDLEEPAAGAVEHDVETVLYRIAQEALNNIAKHAAATQVKIALHRDGDDLVLSIEDNGRGFDVRKAMSRAGGLGLAGMRERASLVGGSCEIESQPGHGTTVRIRVPVDES